MVRIFRALKNQKINHHSKTQQGMVIRWLANIKMKSLIIVFTIISSSGLCWGQFKTFSNSECDNQLAEEASGNIYAQLPKGTKPKQSHHTLYFAYQDNIQLIIINF